MKILVIGGTGYIGSRLVQVLLFNGCNVTILAKDTCPELAIQTKMIISDRSDEHVLKKLFKLEFDIVIDLIAYRPEEIQEMVKVFSGRINRYILLSTIAVYAPPFHYPLSEQEATQFDDETNSYGSLKARCETCLRDAYEDGGFPYVILRSAPIMGPEDPVSREVYFIKRMLGKRPIIHVWKEKSYILSVFIDDLIDAFWQAVVSPKALCKSYHLSFLDCPTKEEYLKALANLLGIEKADEIILPIPQLVNYGFSIYTLPYAPGTQGQLCLSAAQEDLNFKPTLFEKALDATFQSMELNQVDLINISSWPGRNTTQTKFCGTHELLHASVEDAYINGKPPIKPLNIDDFLEMLTDSRRPFSCITHADWTKMTASTSYSIPHIKGEQVLVAPFQLFDLLNSEHIGAHEETELLSPQPLAVLEAVPNESDIYHCYLHQPLINRIDYSFDNYPQRVHVTTSCSLLQRKLKQTDRVIIVCRTNGEFQDFQKWLDHLVTGNKMTDVDLDLFSKCFLVANTEYLTEEGEDQLITNWKHLFDIVRILKRTRNGKCKELSILNANQGQFIPVRSLKIPYHEKAFHNYVLKIKVGQDFYLYDTKEKKLINIPFLFTLVLDHFKPDQVSIDVFTGHLGLDKERAISIHKIYHEQLRQFIEPLYFKTPVNHKL